METEHLLLSTINECEHSVVTLTYDDRAYTVSCPVCGEVLQEGDKAFHIEHFDHG